MRNADGLPWHLLPPPLGNSNRSPGPFLSCDLVLDSHHFEDEVPTSESSKQKQTSSFSCSLVVPVMMWERIVGVIFIPCSSDFYLKRKRWSREMA